MPPLRPRARRIFRQALRRTTLSLKDVAAEMHVGWSTLELYQNRATPSQTMAVKLRHWLERYAEELRTLAAKLPKENTKR